MGNLNMKQQILIWIAERLPILFGALSTAFFGLAMTSAFGSKTLAIFMALSVFFGALAGKRQ